MIDLPGSCSLGRWAQILTTSPHCHHRQHVKVQRTAQRAGRARRRPSGAWLLACSGSHSGHYHANVLWRVRENASWTVPTRERRERERRCVVLSGVSRAGSQVCKTSRSVKNRKPGALAVGRRPKATCKASEFWHLTVAQFTPHNLL